MVTACSAAGFPCWLAGGSGMAVALMPHPARRRGWPPGASRASGWVGLTQGQGRVLVWGEARTGPSPRPANKHCTKTTTADGAGLCFVPGKGEGDRQVSDGGKEMVWSQARGGRLGAGRGAGVRGQGAGEVRQGAGRGTLSDKSDVNRGSRCSSEAIVTGSNDDEAAVPELRLER